MEPYTRRSEISTKSNGSSKVNEKFQNNMLSMNCESSPIFLDFKEPCNVTCLYLQREAKEPTKSYGKEVDIHQIHINMGARNECKSDRDGNEKENGAVDSGESPAKMSTVRVIEEKLCGVIEDCEIIGLYNGLANMSDIKQGYGFIEMKCGCTSLNQIDTLDTLRVYSIISMSV